jgi:excisionase family DNA binding protein
MNKQNLENSTSVVIVPISTLEVITGKLDRLLSLQEQTADNKSEYLTPKEVCKMLKIGRATFERHKSNGTLPVYCIAGTKRKYAKKSEVLQLLHEGKI